MEKETLEQKQKYLRVNILDKGYDPDKFMEFLKNKKGEPSLNLDNWSLKELVEAGNEFIKNNQPLFGKNFKLEKKEDEKDSFNLLYDKNEEKIPQEKYINCSLIEETSISKQNKIEINVSEPQIEKGGIFSFSYSTYLLKTSPLNLEVRRRYSDFIWLYNTLNSQFIKCIIPPFFKKENLDNKKMEQRIFFIEKFLNNISIHPLLRNSKIFYDFISIKEEKEFIIKKNEYNKLTPTSNIKEIKTLNGEIKVSISYDKEKYFQNIKDKLNNQENIFEKLLYNYKTLLNNMEQISEIMKEISKIWKDLYKQKNEYFEPECTSGIYDSFGKVMQEWAGLQNKHYSLIKNTITRFFKYINEEFKSFKDFSYLVENTKNYYYKKKQRLLSAKELIFSEKEESGNKIKNESESTFKSGIKKELEYSKLMLNDTEKVNELEKEYGCYLNCYIGEYERLRDLNSSRIKKNSFNFIKELAAQISSFNFSLGEILSYIDTLTEEGYIGNQIINNEICNNAGPVAGKKI